LADIAIPLVSRRRRRAQVIQHLQHALPSIALLADGIQGLRRGPSDLGVVLAAAEIVTSLLVIVAFIRLLRTLPRGRRAGLHAHRVDWLDLFLAAMLAAEAVNHWHDTGHLSRPTLLLAVTMFGMGVFHQRITTAVSGRRALRLRAGGLTVGGKLFTRFSSTWQDIAAIDVTETQARILTRNGRERRIDLHDLDNEDDVRRALVAAQTRLTSAHAVTPQP
jgi:hypothetical protein